MSKPDVVEDERVTTNVSRLFRRLQKILRDGMKTGRQTSNPL